MILLALLAAAAQHNGWRIADVSSADEPSLLKSLEASNSEARAKH